MDEERGRDLARQNNLSVRGSLGVLIEANAKKIDQRRSVALLFPTNKLKKRYLDQS